MSLNFRTTNTVEVQTIKNIKRNPAVAARAPINAKCWGAYGRLEFEEKLGILTEAPCVAGGAAVVTRRVAVCVIIGEGFVAGVR